MKPTEAEREVRPHGATAWLRNSLKAAAHDQREGERHCRGRRYEHSSMRAEALRLADVYAQAAQVFEDALAALDRSRGEKP